MAPAALGHLDWLYFGVATALGVAFVGQAERLRRGRIGPMALFFASIIYLPLLFLALTADVLLLG